MICRALSRLRFVLSAFALLALLGGLPVTTSEAANPYDYTDGDEGDPGDGVLDPAIDRGSGGGTRDDRADVIAVSGAGWPAGWADAGLVPVVLPTAGTGRTIVLYLPRSWWRPASVAPAADGRWHDAP